MERRAQVQRAERATATVQRDNAEAARMLPPVCAERRNRIGHSPPRHLAPGQDRANEIVQMRLCQRAIWSPMGACLREPIHDRAQSLRGLLDVNVLQTSR